MAKQLHLGAVMRPVAIHTAWWRYPGAYPDANFNFRHIARFAQTLERGKFDAFFMADHLALLNLPTNRDGTLLLHEGPEDIRDIVAQGHVVVRVVHLHGRGDRRRARRQAARGVDDAVDHLAGAVVLVVVAV